MKIKWKTSLLLSSIILLSSNVMAENKGQDQINEKELIHEVVAEVEKKSLTKAEIEKIVENKFIELKTRDEKLEQSTQEIISLIAAAKNLYAARRNYEGLGNKILIQAGAISKSMIKNQEDKVNSELINVFGGETIIKDGKVKLNKEDKESHSVINLVYKGVPKYACLEIPINLYELYWSLEIVNKNGKIILRNNEDKKYDEIESETTEKLKNICGDENTFSLITY